jgi:hypothetical protein
MLMTAQPFPTRSASADKAAILLPLMMGLMVLGTVAGCGKKADDTGRRSLSQSGLDERRPAARSRQQCHARAAPVCPVGR